MARIMNGSSDRIKLINPSGLTITSAWTMGLMVRLTSVSGSGTGLVRISSDDTTGLPRGVLLHLDSGRRLMARTSSGNTNEGATALALGTWHRVTMAFNGPDIRLGLAGAQEVAGASTPGALTTGDAINIGLGRLDFEINALNGAVARFFFLQGSYLTPAAADAIFDDFDAAVSTYGSNLVCINYIEGATAPEPDFRTGSTNAFAITGTTATEDPIGIPGGDPGPDPLEPGTASLGSVRFDRVTLSATDATDGTPPYDYQWERSPAGAATYADVTGQAALECVDATVVMGESYDYRLRYEDAAEGVVYSNVVSGVEVPLRQVVHPIADVSNSGWTPSEGSDLYAMLADPDPSTYVSSSTGRVTDALVVRLASLDTVETDEGDTLVLFRALKIGASGPETGGDVVTVEIELLDPSGDPLSPPVEDDWVVTADTETEMVFTIPAGVELSGEHQVRITKSAAAE